jgi:hypothetical protein
MRFMQRPMLGRASHVKGRPPGIGEQFRTRIADSKEGIIFEIGRMRETVLHQRGDALVNDQAGWNINTWAELRGLSDAERRSNLEMARAQFHWLRGCFQYVPDPHRMEKVQTTNRAVRMSKVPREIIMAATASIYASLNGVDLSEVSLETMRDAMPSLVTKVSGDCDEGSSVLATMCAACGMETRFMLGALQGSEWFHHVWAEADVLGTGTDESFAMGAMDVTEPEFDDVGKYASMDRYKPVFIFRNN